MPEKISRKTINAAITDYISSSMSVNACAKKHDIGATTLTRYLQKTDIDIRKHDLRKHSYNQRFFDKIDTEDKAYWLGFITADGCIVNNGTALEITLGSVDRSHLVKFLDSIEGDCDMLKDRVQKCKDKEHSAARVTVCSVDMVDDLKRQGIFQRKSGSLAFPDLTDAMLRYYLRGYFDGNGSISTNGKCRNGSPKYALNIVAPGQFLEDFMFHMIPYGITRVSLQDKGAVKSWNKTGINQISTVLRYLYDDATVYLDRKHQLKNEICRPASTL